LITAFWKQAELWTILTGYPEFKQKGSFSIVSTAGLFSSKVEMKGVAGLQVVFFDVESHQARPSEHKSETTGASARENRKINGGRLALRSPAECGEAFCGNP
jgi:hypothetical protein